MDSKQPGDIGCGSALGEHAEDLDFLIRYKLGASSSGSPLGTGGLQSGLGTLADHSSLEFGKRAKHLQHHAAG
ncbi:MAG: hypothetical protein P4L10_14955 [Acidobacteriaceae bacterium]|nr:hypothetical protein [Acidobacteriaceae bacterium]